METPTTARGVDIDYEEYVETALEIMERFFFATDQIDWNEIRQPALERLPADPSPEEAYSVLGRALLDLGDSHSGFLSPPMRQDLARSAGETPEPTGERMGRIGYLNLPGVGNDTIDPDDPKFYADRVNEVLEELDKPQPACGWIVDLRENTGGTIGPMFASLGPLLGQGVVLTATGPSGTQTITVGNDFLVSHDPEFTLEDPAEDLPLTGPFTLVDSTEEETLALINAAMSPSGPVYQPETESPPIAVLTSFATASAGEWVTIAFLGRDDTQTFGGITRGVPTGVRGFQFIDGGVLALAASAPSDRIGRTYTTSINPENFVADDEAVEAALDWLAMQSSCN